MLWTAGFDFEQYPSGRSDWSRYQTESLMERWLDARPGVFAPIELNDLQPGDLVGFNVGHCVHHLGIIPRRRPVFSVLGVDGGGHPQSVRADVPEALGARVETCAMSFNTKTASVETETVPVQPEGLSTNQQAVPVPLWWGRRKIAARWITGVTNQIAVEVPNTTAKK